jgi:hypothetical protein
MDAYTQVVRTSATLLTGIVGPTLRHSEPDLEQMLIATEIAAFYASDPAAEALIAAADAARNLVARAETHNLESAAVRAAIDLFEQRRGETRTGMRAGLGLT